MPHQVVFRLGIIAASLFLGSGAQAASFDCGAAKSPDEKAVCSNPSLSALDSQMGGLWYAYSRVPMLMGANGNRQDEAQAFLTARRACGSNVACLTRTYRSRITQLQSEIDAAMADYSRLQNGS